MNNQAPNKSEDVCINQKLCLIVVIKKSKQKTMPLCSLRITKNLLRMILKNIFYKLTAIAKMFNLKLFLKIY